MQQAAEHCGLQVNRRGLCICPFHQDRNPSMKIYPNGKGFYCFTCGIGGDQIKFVALLRGVRNEEAAKELAAAFQIPVQIPRTYREKREAEKAMEQRRKRTEFIRKAKLWLGMYRILLCEARRDAMNSHFEEAVHKLDYVDDVLGILERDPDELWKDWKAVRWIGEIERRVTGWYEST